MRSKSCRLVLLGFSLTALQFPVRGCASRSKFVYADAGGQQEASLPIFSRHLRRARRIEYTGYMGAFTDVEMLAQGKGYIFLRHVVAVDNSPILSAEEVPLLGKSLSQRLLSWTGDKQHAMALAPVVLSILLGEVQATTPVERAEGLQYVVVMFLSLARACGRGEYTSICIASATLMCPQMSPFSNHE